VVDKGSFKAVSLAGVIKLQIGVIHECLLLTIELAYTDTLRRSHIRARNKELQESISNLVPGGEIDYTKHATQAEKDAIKKRCVRVHLQPLSLLLAACVSRSHVCRGKAAHAGTLPDHLADSPVSSSRGDIGIHM
jgi:hypothetical protein